MTDGRGELIGHDSLLVRVSRIVVGSAAMLTVFANMFIVASLPAGLDAFNYFSFFTNLTNLLGGAVFLVSGLRVRRRLPPWWDDLRGAFALYLALTGLVYALLLAGLPSAGTVTPWVNFVVHQAIPIVAVLDWLIVPAAVAAPWWRPLVWLGYPVAYRGYSLVRGALVDWYPYPFLDPRLGGGYGRLVVSTGFVVLGFLVGAVVIDAAGRLRRRLTIENRVSSVR